MEVISALISLSGVVLSVAISFVISLQNNKYNYKQLFAQTVSEKRIEWINSLREEVAILIAFVKTNNERNNKNEEKELAQYYKNKTQALTRLRVDNPHHLLLIKEIERLCINFEKGNSDLDEQIKNIIEVERLVLKSEWEEMKDEAKNDRR